MMLESMRSMSCLDVMLRYLLLTIGYGFANNFHNVFLISLRIASLFIYVVLISLLVIISMHEMELIENEVKMNLKHNSKGMEWNDERGWLFVSYYDRMKYETTSVIYVSLSS
jgi:hypothetical protein